MSRAHPGAGAGPYRFETTCIGAHGDDIQEMAAGGVQVSWRTFARALGPRGWRNLAATLGYDRSVPMSRDWAVGYFRGYYRGKAAFWARWSGIEHIFVLDR